MTSELMVTWAAPWAWIMLPLPLILRLLCQRYGWSLSPAPEALRVPFYQHLQRQQSFFQPPTRRHLQASNWVSTLIWLLLIAALARPQWQLDTVKLPQPNRDFLIAIDLSQSMQTEDMQVTPGLPLSRLQIVKTLLKQLLDQRPGDRFGLIVFGSAPYIQTPFTLDHNLFMRLLDELDVGMAGPRTMLGDAVGLAIKHFTATADDSRDVRDKTLLLITDGVDSGSQVPVEEAAQLAARQHIQIHTLLIGRSGQAGSAAIDPTLLARISAITRGQAFTATDSGSLNVLIETLDTMTPSQIHYREVAVTRDVFHWPLAAALALGLLQLLVEQITQRRAQQMRQEPQETMETYEAKEADAG